MKQIKNALCFLVIASLWGCKGGESKEFELSSVDSVASPATSGYKSNADSSAFDTKSRSIISSSAAVEKNKYPDKKFVRTADIRFKVKNVEKSTYDIENIVTNNDGFVTYTNLKSNIENITKYPLTSDSSIQVTTYNVTNSIVIRVPNSKLDTTLKDISRNINFLDYRIIKADDVSLQMLSNELSQQRIEKHSVRLINAIDTKAKKLNEQTNAEELLLSKQETIDNAKVANLTLKDQVAFSTVNIEIYQASTIKKEIVEKDKSYDDFQPNFFVRLFGAIVMGWNVLAAIIVFLFQVWFLFVIAGIAYYLYKRFDNKVKP